MKTARNGGERWASGIDHERFHSFHMGLWDVRFESGLWTGEIENIEILISIYVRLEFVYE